MQDDWRRGVVDQMTPEWGEVVFEDGSHFRFTPGMCFRDGTSFGLIRSGDEARVKGGGVSVPRCALRFGK